MVRPPSARVQGWTMVEVIVVVAVMAILAGVAVPVTAGLVLKSKINATKKELSALGESLRAYAGDQKFDPASVKWGRFAPELAAAGAYGTVLGGELDTAAAGATFDPVLGYGWNGPYIHSGDETCDPDGSGTSISVRGYRVDAWGRYYRYRNRAAAPAGAFVTGVGQTRVLTLESGGPDRDLSTATDNLSLEVYRGPAY